MWREPAHLHAQLERNLVPKFLEFVLCTNEIRVSCFPERRYFKLTQNLRPSAMRSPSGIAFHLVCASFAAAIKPSSSDVEGYWRVTSGCWECGIIVVWDMVRGWREASTRSSARCEALLAIYCFLLLSFVMRPLTLVSRHTAVTPPENACKVRLLAHHDILCMIYAHLGGLQMSSLSICVLVEWLLPGVHIHLHTWHQRLA